MNLFPFRRLKLKVALVGLCALIGAPAIARDQKDPLAAGEAAKANDTGTIKKSIASGRALKTDLTVKGNVKAQAVLIPQIDARRIFGKEIANNYAIIAVTVSNKSPDAAMILHGAYIDYSQWALKGGESEPSSAPESNGPLTDFEAQTVSSQVASVEARLIRGQLLDAQQQTPRNWTVRLLTFAGALASASSFAFREPGIAKGIAAFGGTLVPGVGTAWPDETVAQLNRISDFGYQVNKVIPKQSADIVVCFFPIDRFLTPGFKKLFLQSPAVFFSPLQILYDPDPKVAALVTGDLKYVFSGSASADDLRKVMPCYLDWRKPKAEAEGCAAQAKNDPKTSCPPVLSSTAVCPSLNDDVRREIEFVQQMSLNTITVVVDGAMSIDTTQMAGKIDDIICDDNGDPASFWTNTTDPRTCTIHGAYLTGGEVTINEAKDQKITDIATIADGSSDTQLNLSFSLGQEIPTGTTLHFVVTKKSKDTTAADKTGTSTNSNEYGYVVSYTPTADSSNGEVNCDDADWSSSNSHDCNVSGSNLAGSDVKVVDAKGRKVADAEVVPDDSTDSQLHVRFTPVKPVAEGTPLHFVVSKKPAGSQAGEKPAKPVENRYPYTAGNNPKINSVRCEEQGKAADSDRECDIDGEHLDGGEVKVVDEKGEEIGHVDVTPTNERHIHVKLHPSKPIADHSPVHVVVTKNKKSSKPGETTETVKSDKEHVVEYKTKPDDGGSKGATKSGSSPIVAKAETKGKKVTVTGSHLSGADRKVKLHRVDKEQPDKIVAADPDGSDSSATADVSNVEGGCYTARVTAAGKDSADSPAFPVMKIKSAARAGDHIVVKGEGLKDDSGHCQTNPRFRLESGASKLEAKAKEIQSDQATLDLPAAAKKGPWRVRLLGGKDTTGTVAPLN